jgi:hypothetical protein
MNYHYHYHCYGENYNATEPSTSELSKASYVFVSAI